MIDKIIVPKLGKLRLKSIGTKDIGALHSGLKDTPFRANRVLALLSKMFTLAVQWGWRYDNPVRSVPRFPEDRRERWLSLDEIQRLFDALERRFQEQLRACLKLDRCMKTMSRLARGLRSCRRNGGRAIRGRALKRPAAGYQVFIGTRPRCRHCRWPEPARQLRLRCRSAPRR